MKTLEKDQVYCPDNRCIDGKLCERCPVCQGDGEEPRGEGCGNCGGLGEVNAGTCGVCDGKQVVSFALRRLYEADRWVSSNQPDWDGDNASHPGVTLFSTAHWYRKRKEWGPRVASVTGGFLRTPDPDGFYATMEMGSPFTHAVQLLDENDVVLITFWGFAWGFGGEGPNGLAAVLADALPSRFETFEAAMQFVSSRAQNEKWEAR